MGTTVKKMVTIDEAGMLCSENKERISYFENRNYLLDQTWSNWNGARSGSFFM
jgi:hypothetical protein